MDYFLNKIFLDGKLSLDFTVSDIFASLQNNLKNVETDCMTPLLSEICHELDAACVGWRLPLKEEVPSGVEPSDCILCRRCADGREISLVAVEMLPGYSRVVDGIISYPVIYESKHEAPIVILRDRWERNREMILSRMMAHLGVFRQVYARNCEIRRIDKPTAADFLAKYHSYGDASCKYRYGMYLLRSTGAKNSRFIAPGTLVAVSSFSSPRRWHKGDGVLSSYEWTRYASLPDVRICGGMGKMLQYFIDEVGPDDIMSYADVEWSEGMVYKSLGFMDEGHHAPVDFEIDCSRWTRRPLASRKANTAPELMEVTPTTGNTIIYRAPGSIKYRLKLTAY